MDGSRNKATSAQQRDVLASLKPAGLIEIPGAHGSAFDRGIFDPGSGYVFIAHVDQPAGLVETIEPRTRNRAGTTTGADAHTTVLAPPDRLYVISAAHRRVLVLADT